MQTTWHFKHKLLTRNWVTEVTSNLLLFRSILRIVSYPSILRRAYNTAVCSTTWCATHKYGAIHFGNPSLISAAPHFLGQGTPTIKVARTCTGSWLHAKDDCTSREKGRWPAETDNDNQTVIVIVKVDCHMGCLEILGVTRQSCSHMWAFLAFNDVRVACGLGLAPNAAAACVAANSAAGMSFPNKHCTQAHTVP